jgi:hypothetical protein
MAETEITLEFDELPHVGFVIVLRLGIYTLINLLVVVPLVILDRILRMSLALHSLLEFQKKAICLFDLFSLLPEEKEIHAAKHEKPLFAFCEAWCATHATLLSIL